MDKINKKTLNFFDNLSKKLSHGNMNTDKSREMFYNKLRLGQNNEHAILQDRVKKALRGELKLSKEELEKVKKDMAKELAKWEMDYLMGRD